MSARRALHAATVSEASGVRYLHLGTEWVQGAMRIAKPDAIELEYVQRMLAWMLWRPTVELAQGRAVQLGLGAGTLTRFTHRRLRMPTTVVEINPSVVHVARLWFRLPPEDDARLDVVVGDAQAWVDDDANARGAAVLNVDLYDHRAASPVLDDDAFYVGCRRVLADGGVMSVNLFGRDASFAGSAARIVDAFGRDQVWRMTPTREGNSIVIATRGVVVPDRDELERRAADDRFPLRLAGAQVAAHGATRNVLTSLERLDTPASPIAAYHRRLPDRGVTEAAKPMSVDPLQDSAR